MIEWLRNNSWATAIIGAILIVLLISVLNTEKEEALDYASIAIESGPIREVVSATGTLSALITVEVGSQLSGQISELFVDFNSEVKEGEVIARLDPATFETRVAQAEAELAIAKANVTQAKASLSEARALDNDAVRSRERNEDLRKRGNVSAAQLETAIANAEQTRARLISAQAQIETAEAQVNQRQASLDSAKVDLERTYIRSPVGGVVIERAIDVGQTVAASLQAPILFTIAKDLRQMQLEVSVDEADIGRVQKDLPVSFTVDAYPEKVFNGQVEQVRKAPLVEQNVVTYTVIVSTENNDQFLLPGMTANVEIIIDERENALLIPNQAFRFMPENGREEIRQLMASGTVPDRSEGPIRYIWLVESGDNLEPLPVSIGINDGFKSEVLSDRLKSGDLVAVSASSAAAASRRGGPRPPGFF